MGALLRKIKSYYLYHEVEMGILADDLAALHAGKDRIILKNKLTTFISKIIE